MNIIHILHLYSEEVAAIVKSGDMVSILECQKSLEIDKIFARKAIQLALVDPSGMSEAWIKDHKVLLGYGDLLLLERHISNIQFRLDWTLLRLRSKSIVQAIVRR